MFGTPGLLAAARRPVWIALGMTIGVMSAGPLQAQQPAAPAQAAQAAPTTRVFSGDAGMVLNFIKADKVADFEMVVAKLKEALAKSAKPERKQQATSWKIFKAAEPGAGGSVLYVFIVDPSVKGADYRVSTSCGSKSRQHAEANEIVQEVRGRIRAGQNIVNLSLVPTSANNPPSLGLGESPSLRRRRTSGSCQRRSGALACAARRFQV